VVAVPCYSYTVSIMTRQTYTTDVTDSEWSYLEPHLPAPKSGGRPRRHAVREILNAIFYALRSGCTWRLLPHDLPPWRMVSYDCRQWRQDGTWQLRHDLLRGDVRVAVGKQRQPSAGIIASQSVKTTDTGGSAALMRTNTCKAANALSSSIRSG